MAQLHLVFLSLVTALHAKLTADPNETTCSQPVDSGPCEYYRKMWYWDPRNAQCRPFEYGGCEGNDNKFMTEEECTVKCIKDVPKMLERVQHEEQREENPRDALPGLCLEQPDSGGCGMVRNRFIRGRWHYYFDREQHKCSLFWYWGCGGNGNRFMHKRECKQTCVARRWRHMTGRASCARCEPRTAFCHQQTNGNFTCLCKRGFIKNSKDLCIDENECLTNKHDCDPSAWCENTVGSYKCSCKIGYQGDGKKCQPIASKDNFVYDCNKCHSKADCIDGQCLCKNGFQGDGYFCEDENECTRPDACSVNAECYNTAGSYYCQCRIGYAGNGFACSSSSEACGDYFSDQYRSSCGQGEWQPRFYFDSQEKKCKRFWYDSCDSSSRNIFTDIQTCQTMCEKPAYELVTSAPACHDKFDDKYMDQCGHGNWQERFFFNQTLGKCEKFWFDSCVSTSSNIFTDYSTCQQMCEQEEIEMGGSVTTVKHPTSTGVHVTAKVETTYDSKTEVTNRPKVTAEIEQMPDDEVDLKVTAKVTPQKPAFTNQPAGVEKSETSNFDFKVTAKLTSLPTAEPQSTEVENLPSTDFKMKITARLTTSDEEDKGTGRPTTESTKGTDQLVDNGWTLRTDGGIWSYTRTMQFETKTTPGQKTTRHKRTSTIVAATPKPKEQESKEEHYFSTSVCDEPFDFAYTDQCREGNWESRWYFNKSSGYCEMFFYDGCRGAGRNIFMDFDSCVSSCEKPHRLVANKNGEVVERTHEISPACNDPFDRNYFEQCGNGDWSERFYYNPPTKTCEKFWYDGCTGTSRNIFMTEENCNSNCGLDFEVVPIDFQMSHWVATKTVPDTTVPESLEPEHFTTPIPTSGPLEKTTLEEHETSKRMAKTERMTSFESTVETMTSGIPHETSKSEMITSEFTIQPKSSTADLEATSVETTEEAKTEPKIAATKSVTNVPKTTLLNSSIPTDSNVSELADSQTNLFELATLQPELEPDSSSQDNSSLSTSDESTKNASSNTTASVDGILLWLPSCDDAVDQAYFGQCGNGDWQERYFYNKTTKLCQKFWFDFCLGTGRNIFVDRYTCETTCDVATKFDPRLQTTTEAPDFVEFTWNFGMEDVPVKKTPATEIYTDVYTEQWTMNEKNENVTTPEVTTEVKTSSVPTATSNHPLEDQPKQNQKQQPPKDKSFHELASEINEMASQAVEQEDTKGHKSTNKSTGHHQIANHLEKNDDVLSPSCTDSFDMSYIEQCGDADWTERYFFNQTSRMCEKFWYDQCPGNSRNIFKKLSVCEELCDVGKRWHREKASPEEMSNKIDDHPKKGSSNPNWKMKTTAAHTSWFENNLFSDQPLKPTSTNSQPRQTPTKSKESKPTKQPEKMTNSTHELNEYCEDKFDHNYRGRCRGGKQDKRYYFNHTMRTCGSFMFDGCPGMSRNFFRDLLACRIVCEPHKVGKRLGLWEWVPPSDTKTTQAGYIDSNPDPTAVYSFGRKVGKAEEYNVVPQESKDSTKDVKSHATSHYSKEFNSVPAESSGPLHGQVPITGGINMKAKQITVASAGCEEPFDERYAKSCGGQNWQTKYYFDNEKKQCQMFWFDQCKGEGKNIYPDLETCQWLCEGTHPKPEASACLETFDEQYTRDCYGGHWNQRFYFDHSSKRCLMFWYGGCQSESKNIFRDAQTCHNLCERPHRGLSRACLGPFDSEYKESCGNNFQMRYYYDVDSRECRMFWYGNCKGKSENIFPDLATCQWLCERSKESDPPKHCIDVFDEGYRKSCGDGAWQERYYFDHHTGSCKSFFYDNCKSESQNIFPDKRTCQWLCEVPSPPYHPPSNTPDECLQDFDAGHCELAYPAFYYNRYEGRCLPFSYTGCGGNRNRFLTSQQCEHTCSIFMPVTGEDTDCLLPLDIGYGRHNSKCVRKARFMYYYNRDYGKCGRFWFFGCGGNSNRYETEAECNIICTRRSTIVKLSAAVDPAVCFIAKDDGQCDYIDNKPMNRVAYDFGLRKCVEFNYNGCGGNQNRFGSIQACESACGGMRKPKTAYCAAWPDWGPCNQLRWVWFYNMTEGVCQQFLWGGCEGNMNRFETFEECQVTCEVSGKDSCSDPLDRGIWCERLQFRYYYNSQEQRCRGFHYTGCGSSANNFKTMSECENACIHRNVTIGQADSAKPQADEPLGAGEYSGTKPDENQPIIQKHVFLEGDSKRYLKTPTTWVDYSQCLGFRYTVFNKFALLRTHLCLMEGSGECISESLGFTDGREKCRILRPWLKGFHLYSWFFTLESRPKRWHEYPVPSAAKNETLATLLLVGVNRCWDAC